MDNRSEEKNSYKVIFLSSMLPEESYGTIRKNSKGPISNANNNFQHSILDGLVECAEGSSPIYVVNAPNIGAYPFRYRKPYYRGTSTLNSSTQFSDISFLNLPIIKHIFRKSIIKSRLKRIIQNTLGKPIILSYDLDPSFVNSLYELRESGYNFISINIVPDIPGHTGEVDHWAYKIFKQLKNSNLSLDAIDGFVLLSKHMVQPLKIETKPFIIMEGIYSINQSYTTESQYSKLLKGSKFILYTGALDTRNGVPMLVEAFKRINPSFNYNLVLCGDGDAKTFVENATKIDHRIKYLGQLNHNEVIALQKEATLLINPRVPSNDFSKISFPSKTLEYMASGTPVLMHKLESLPDEYKEYLYLLEDEDIDTLKNKILTILSMDNNSLRIKGDTAKSFIVNNKSSKKQVKRIIDFAKSLK